MQISAAYRLSLSRRILNRIVRYWIRLGLPPRKYHILTVKGRLSGRLHSTPVSVVQINEHCWLVAPFGQRNWVKNARVARQITLSRGEHSEDLTVEEEYDPNRCAQCSNAISTKNLSPGAFLMLSQGHPMKPSPRRPNAIRSSRYRDWKPAKYSPRLPNIFNDRLPCPCSGLFLLAIVKHGAIRPPATNAHVSLVQNLSPGPRHGNPDMLVGYTLSSKT